MEENYRPLQGESFRAYSDNDECVCLFSSEKNVFCRDSNNKERVIPLLYCRPLETLEEKETIKDIVEILSKLNFRNGTSFEDTTPYIAKALFKAKYRKNNEL